MAQRRSALGGDHTIAKHPEHVAAGQPGDPGDMALGQTLHPLHEPGVQLPSASPSGHSGFWCGSPEDGFPPADRGSVATPGNQLTGASSQLTSSRGISPRAISSACSRLGEEELNVIALRDVLLAATRGAGRSWSRASDDRDGRTAAPGEGDWLCPYSTAVGVGSNCWTAEGSIRSPELPRWFGPPLAPSVALGVGSNEEQPLTSMGGAHGGRR